MKALLEKIKIIACECADIMLEANSEAMGVSYKEGIGNIVTKYDSLIQDELKNRLLGVLPKAGFVGEENDEADGAIKEYTFVVDPIDGTVNFARGNYLSAVSIALLKNGEPVLAVCRNPYINETYWAIKGEGAYLNGRQIHVSNKLLKDGIVFCGCSPYYGELRQKSLEMQHKFASQAADFRRFGSAVIEICAIAAGKAEVYFELRLMPWDYAAASLILTEAGGTITDITGQQLQYKKPTSVLAGNGKEDYIKYTV